MEFQVSHIFKEGNHAADALSKYALDLDVTLRWYTTPALCSSLVGNDCMSMESFHFR